MTALVVRRARAADLDAVADLTVAAYGVVVGAVTWCPSGSLWREIAEDDEGEFRTLAVAAGARGRGVGEALGAACVDRARAAGYRGLAISTMAAMTHAHQLYLRLGFAREPEADWSPRPEIELLAFRLRF